MLEKIFDFHGTFQFRAKSAPKNLTFLSIQRSPERQHVFSSYLRSRHPHNLAIKTFNNYLNNYINFYSHAPRGARPVYVSNYNEQTFISTHTPLAGRDRLGTVSVRDIWISTHTPLAGRDINRFFSLNLLMISTHTPLAGRDPVTLRPYRTFTISTHTPLAGRDKDGFVGERAAGDFYSHAPRGARQFVQDVVLNETTFLLTRPSRGATRMIRES